MGAYAYWTKDLWLKFQEIEMAFQGESGRCVIVPDAMRPEGDLYGKIVIETEVEREGLKSRGETTGYSSLLDFIQLKESLEILQSPNLSGLSVAFQFAASKAELFISDASGGDYLMEARYEVTIERHRPDSVTEDISTCSLQTILVPSAINDALHSLNEFLRIAHEECP